MLTFFAVIFALFICAALVGILALACVLDENAADEEYQSRLQSIADREKRGRVLMLRTERGQIR